MGRNLVLIVGRDEEPGEGNSRVASVIEIYVHNTAPNALTASLSKSYTVGKPLLYTIGSSFFYDSIDSE